MLILFNLKKNIFLFIHACQFSILTLVLLFLYIKNNIFISSFLYGGLTSFASSLFLGIFLQQKSTKNVLKNFYLAIFFKTCFLFLIFLSCLTLGITSPVYFFISLIVVQTSYWFGCFLYSFLYGDIFFYERK